MDFSEGLQSNRRRRAWSIFLFTALYLCMSKINKKKFVRWIWRLELPALWGDDGDIQREVRSQVVPAQPAASDQRYSAGARLLRAHAHGRRWVWLQELMTSYTFTLCQVIHLPMPGATCPRTLHWVVVTTIHISPQNAAEISLKKSGSYISFWHWEADNNWYNLTVSMSFKKSAVHWVNNK